MKELEVLEVQSLEYAFPYHHLVNVQSSKIYKAWPFGFSYVAAFRLVTDALNAHYMKSNSVTNRHVDIGCGDGGFICALSRDRRFSALQLDGIDIDERATAWASLFAQDHKNIHISKTSVSDLPESRFSSFSLIEVLEHVPPCATDEFLENCSKILECQGIGVVTVPSVEKKLIDKHYRHFSADTLRVVLKPHFDIETIVGFEKLDFISKILLNVLARTDLVVQHPVFSRFLVSRLVRRFDVNSIRHCGRLFAIVKKKTRN